MIRHYGFNPKRMIPHYVIYTGQNTRPTYLDLGTHSASIDIYHHPPEGNGICHLTGSSLYTVKPNSEAQAVPLLSGGGEPFCKQYFTVILWSGEDAFCKDKILEMQLINQNIPEVCGR